jgi:hypothetical protein
MSLQLNNHDRESPRGTVSVRQANQVLENLQEHVGRHGIQSKHIDTMKEKINHHL